MHGVKYNHIDHVEIYIMRFNLYKLLLSVLCAFCVVSVNAEVDTLRLTLGDGEAVDIQLESPVEMTVTEDGELALAGTSYLWYELKEYALVDSRSGVEALNQSIKLQKGDYSLTDLQGVDYTNHVTIGKDGKVSIAESDAPSGVYILKLKNKTVKLYKK